MLHCQWPDRCVANQNIQRDSSNSSVFIRRPNTSNILPATDHVHSELDEIADRPSRLTAGKSRSKTAFDGTYVLHENGEVDFIIMNTVLLDELIDFSTKALIQSGVSETDAQTITDVLVTTDTFGVVSHGTKNLYEYIKKMQAGGVNPKAVPTIEGDGPAWAIINGNAAMGMVTSCKAMNLAIEKARKVGIGYVGVKNSCHFGAAGYYSNMAAAQGMIGIAMSNSDPNMAIPNSCRPAIGNNPFSFAAPLKGGRSVFLDIALSNVAALKVAMARDKGESVPAGWLVDKEGQPTTDSSGFPHESFLMPMAAHKGYGLAIMVEILTSVMTGAGLLSEIASWNLDLASKNNVGHAFIAVDASKMISNEVLEARMEKMTEELRSAPKANHASRIFVPGEMEWDKREAALQSGRLALTDIMITNLKKLSEMTGIGIKLLAEGWKEK